MDDELDSRELERARRRDRDADAESRALLQPGMGKVFKQIQDAQVKAGKSARSANSAEPIPDRPAKRRRRG